MKIGLGREIRFGGKILRSCSIFRWHGRKAGQLSLGRKKVWHQSGTVRTVPNMERLQAILDLCQDVLKSGTVINRFRLWCLFANFSVVFKEVHVRHTITYILPLN